MTFELQFFSWFFPNFFFSRNINCRFSLLSENLLWNLIVKKKLHPQVELKMEFNWSYRSYNKDLFSLCSTKRNAFDQSDVILNFRSFRAIMSIEKWTQEESRRGGKKIHRSSDKWSLMCQSYVFDSFSHWIKLIHIQFQ